MPMTGPQLLWTAAGVAGAMALVRLWLLRSRRVPHELFNSIVLKVGLGGNWPRSYKLCQSAPEVPYCGAVGEVIKNALDFRGQTHPLYLTSQLGTQFETAYAARAGQLAEPKWLNWLAWLVLLGPLVYWHKTLLTMPDAKKCLALFAVSAALLIIDELWTAAQRRADSAAGAALMEKLATALQNISSEPKPEAKAAPADAASASDSAWEGAGLTLQVYREDSLLAEHRFAQGVIKIGRLSSAQVGAGEPSVSRMHAVIELSADGKAMVIDLGSESGTLVNGTRRTKSPLQQGDELRVGALRLVIKQLGTHSPGAGGYLN